ncbi:hypothetical protein COY23_03660 [bacterium (Candidatus Torokbacteria) CG_4_10_14_0_2_um_filter_35_8]|nr:MAG: hypothetical protein COY23_03660 [bacterium (Candidatus Torokbacteria) CG_4_10_14_0_2_um_filter_35_8]
MTAQRESKNSPIKIKVKTFAKKRIKKTTKTKKSTIKSMFPFFKKSESKKKTRNSTSYNFINLGKIPTGPSYKKIAFVFIFIAIILLGTISYFSFSKAEIFIIPKKETLPMDFEVVAHENPSLESQNAITGEIVSQEASESKKITVSEKQGVESYASGEVTIYNKRSQAQAIVKGSRLWPNGKSTPQFRTQAWVSIPAGGTAKVKVVCDQKGKIGDIGPVRFIFPGFKSEAYQKTVYAESYTKMTGGYKEVSMILKENVEDAKKELENELYEKATDKLKGKAEKEGKVIIEEGIKKELVDSSSNAKIGKIGERTFTASAKVKATTIQFSKKEALEIAKKKIKQHVPEGKEFTQINEDTFSYEIKNLDLRKKEVILELHIEGDLILKVTSKIFDKDKIAGLNEQELKEYFSQFNDVDKVEIKFTPSWLKTIPTLHDHINIQIK